MIDVINTYWKWMQVASKEVIATNSFGNVIFSDEAGKAWRICPEKLSCDLIGINDQDLEDKMNDEDFMSDWEMKPLFEMAEAKLGALTEGKVYCLKFPPVLGGLYEESNLGIISQEELIKFSGEMAFQIKDLPDGAKIKIEDLL